MPTLPTDSSERKRYPLFSGLMRYFPAALAGVANHSVSGNEKHIHPGRPYNPDIDVLRHDRTKSTDHEDCILRHLVDLADLRREYDELCQSRCVDTQECAVPATGRAILDEANALAWRALALAQEMHERYGSADSAPAAYWPKPKPEPAYWPESEATEERPRQERTGPEYTAVTVDPHIVPGPDGWIEHDGTAYSEPADGDMLVQVRLRCDPDARGIGARGVGVPARTFRWNHTGSGSDIVAWRPAS